jgi:hypothetical protein
MQSQLMQRMECIEKHMDETVATLADLVSRESQGDSKNRDSSAGSSRNQADNL